MPFGGEVVSKTCVNAVIQKGVTLSCGLDCRLGMISRNSCRLHSGILRFRQCPLIHRERVKSWRGRSASGWRVMLCSLVKPIGGSVLTCCGCALEQFSISSEVINGAATRLISATLLWHHISSPDGPRRGLGFLRIPGFRRSQARLWFHS